MSMPMAEYRVLRQLTEDETMEQFLSEPGGSRRGPVDRRYRRSSRRPLPNPLGDFSALRYVR